MKHDFLNKMNKKHIKNYPIKKYEYDRLKIHYWNIHEPILKFWSEPSQLEKNKKLMNLGSRADLIDDGDISDNVI